MATKGLGDLFMATLQDVYYAEQEILGSLHEMESAADSERLRNAFAQHRGETEGQKGENRRFHAPDPNARDLNKGLWRRALQIAGSTRY